ncbi:MAG TPA: FGGY family carbohydrate kinase [Pseudomonadales bacterium]|nr:FGGY family carbohydrate kinase [Pseudomonadales bacterium]
MPIADPVLALDLGTTGVRAVVFDGEGHKVGQAYRRLDMQYPTPDRVEQDARQFHALGVEVMREALATSKVPARDLRGLGIVSQRGSAVAWDARTGQPLAPVIGWQDRRTLARVTELRELGIPVNTLAACTKFEWLLTQDAVRAAADAGTLRLGTPDAWLSWTLSGGEAFVTDPSNAGATGLYDPASGGWFDMALGLFGQELGWHAGLVATDAVVGVLDDAVLGAPVPLAARAGDQQAACFAQGVDRPGAAKVTLGTSAMLDRCTGDAPMEPPTGAYALPLWRREGVGDAFCLEGTVITAGAAVEWLIRTGLLASADELDAVAVGGARGVSFVPALAGLGTPWMADRARGRFDGIGLDTGAAEMVAAVVDGIAQRVTDLAEALEVEATFGVDGGLGRSDVLLQRIADLSGRVVARAAETETTARGAAGLAAAAPGTAGGALPAPAAARRFEPVMDAATRAAERARWGTLIDGMTQAADAT